MCLLYVSSNVTSSFLLYPPFPSPFPYPPLFSSANSSGDVRDLKLLPNGDIVAVGFSQQIQVWEFNRAKPASLAMKRRPATSAEDGCVVM